MTNSCKTYLDIETTGLFRDKSHELTCSHKTCEF